MEKFRLNKDNILKFNYGTVFNPDVTIGCIGLQNEGWFCVGMENTGFLNVGFGITGYFNSKITPDPVKNDWYFFNAPSDWGYDEMRDWCQTNDNGHALTTFIEKILTQYYLEQEYHAANTDALKEFILALPELEIIKTLPNYDLDVLVKVVRDYLHYVWSIDWKPTYNKDYEYFQIIDLKKSMSDF